MQRIAIARAIYSNHPILLLDEATSALDEATEKQLLENLRRQTNQTVLIVTHRSEVLKACNVEVRVSQKQATVHNLQKEREFV
jgi:ATP-binding cassette subfamily B protein